MDRDSNYPGFDDDFAWDPSLDEVWTDGESEDYDDR